MSMIHLTIALELRVVSQKNIRRVVNTVLHNISPSNILQTLILPAI